MHDLILLSNANIYVHVTFSLSAGKSQDPAGSSETFDAQPRCVVLLFKVDALGTPQKCEAIEIKHGKPVIQV